MKIYANNAHRSADRRGVILVLMAVLLPMLLALAAFSVDITFMQMVRGDLRAATDAAARAGGEALSRAQNVDVARQAAKSIAAANLVAGQPLQLADEDIIFGNSSQQNGRWVFSTTKTPINSCRVRGLRTADSLSGPVELFFGRAIGTAAFEPTMVSTVVRLDRDVCLVVDRSSSMKFTPEQDDVTSSLTDAQICSPPDANARWHSLVAAVEAFISGANETPSRENLALVGYSSAVDWCDVITEAATIDQNLTSNYSQVTGALDNYTRYGFNGRTNISSGIDAGVQVLTESGVARPFAYKTMVLFTDGLHNEGRDLLEAAADAAAQGVVIHTITFSNAANQQDMQAVANATGGDHYHAPTAYDLITIFHEIASGMPVMFTE